MSEADKALFQSAVQKAFEESIAGVFRNFVSNVATAKSSNETEAARIGAQTGVTLALAVMHFMLEDHK